MPTNKFIDQFDIDIWSPFSGEDKTFCVGVISFTSSPAFKGSCHSCDNDMDFHGYTEMEYILLNEDGSPDPSLVDELTQHEAEAIENRIIDRQQTNRCH